jgi:hypothetical protein
MVSLPATPLQQGMIAHWLSDPRAGHDTVVHEVELRGSLDAEAVAVAWRLLRRRFAALRACADLSLPEPRIRVDPPECVDAVDAAGSVPAPAAGNAPDITRSPLVTVDVAPRGPDRTMLVWSGHHLMIDGWSRMLVIRELIRLCGLLDGGAGRPGPTGGAAHGASLEAAMPADTLADAARVVAGRDREQVNGYWADLLASPARHWPDVPAVDGDIATAAVRLDPAEHDALIRAAREARVTPALIALLAWGATLARFLGTPEVVLGEVTSGRAMLPPHLLQSVGMLACTLPVVLSATPSYSPAALRERQRQAVRWLSFEHPELWLLARQLGVPAGAGLFTSLFAVENYPIPPAAEGSLRIGDATSRHRTGYPLCLRVHLDRGGGAAVVEYDVDRLPGAALLSRYRAELSSATKGGG